MMSCGQGVGGWQNSNSENGALLVGLFEVLIVILSILLTQDQVKQDWYFILVFSSCGKPMFCS